MKTRKTAFRITGMAALVALLWTSFQHANGQTTNPQQPVSGRENRTGMPNRPNAANSMTQPLTEMINQLKTVRRTGDPDLDYAQLIRIHNQTEAELLNKGIKTSKDPNLARTIQNLMPQKDKEGSDLRKITVQIRGGSPNPAFAQQIDQKLLAMEMDWTDGMNGKLTGDADKDFLSILSQHQQDSIDLTESYLPFAKDPALKAYAEQLLTNRRKELDTIKAMMKS